MADEARRRLERELKTTDSVSAELDLLRARARAGERVVDRIPEGWTFLSSRSRPGGVQLFFWDAERRIWSAAHASDGETLAAPTGVSVRPPVHVDAGCEGFVSSDHVVIDGEVGVEVLALSSGETVFQTNDEVTPIPLPAGLGVGLAREDGLSVLGLAPPYAPETVPLMPLPQPVEWDNPADGAASALGSSHIAVLIACYGSCELLRCRRDDGHLRVEQTRQLPALVYDPVYVSRGVGTKHLLHHGYGTALSVVDLTDGSQVECPLPPDAVPDYGLFRASFVSPSGELALITTRDRPYLWTFPSTLRPLPQAFTHALHLENTTCVVNEGGVLRTRSLAEVR